MSASIWAPNGFSPEVVPLNFFEYTATALQTTFSIAPFTQLYDSQVKVWKSGELLRTTAWEVSGTNVVLSSACAGGEFLRIDVYEASPSGTNEVPPQLGHAGEFLSTNGLNLSWELAPTELPVQGGHAGHALFSDGSLPFWAALPVPAQGAYNLFAYLTEAQIADYVTGAQTLDFGLIIQGVLDILPSYCTLDFPAGTIKVLTTITVTKNGVTLSMDNGLTINHSVPATNSTLILAGTRCHLIGPRSGGFIGPASWDGTNGPAPSYGVIKVAGAYSSVSNTRLYNVRRVGIWAKDVEDCVISKCLIEGNYPAASWTGIETGHWGIVCDPGSVGLSGGNFILDANIIKSCVQGCQPGNYGTAPVGGILRGFVTTGNIFESCWNHGIYSNFTNGATIVGNNFNRCQIPVVISGSHNVVTGNSMITYVTVPGDERDVLGISVRDGVGNVISGNTVKGVLTAPSNVVAINLQDVSGLSEINDNIVTNNVIHISQGSGVAIRISGSTKTVNNNVIANNTINAPGIVGEGVIGVYGPNSAVAYITAITKASPGVFTTAAAHGRVVNDVIYITEVQGMVEVNKIYKINTVPLVTTFTLKDYFTGVPLDTTAFTTYTSLGTVRDPARVSSGNKVTNNSMVISSASYGVYGLYQDGLVVSRNTADYRINAVGAAVPVVTVATFACFTSSVEDNHSIVRPGYGANLEVYGYREFVEGANNYTSNNVDGVSKLLGAIFQPVESLPGSGLRLDQASPASPSTQCSPGSVWRKTSGGVNDTLFIKQFGAGSSGWTPMGVALLEVGAAALAAKADSINTAEKYRGKLVWDTTNNKMYRASGPADVDRWYLCDGSGNILPV